jgi:thioredoxin-related protein
MKKIVYILMSFVQCIIFAQTKKPVVNGYEININTQNLAGKKIVMFFNYGIGKKKIFTDTLEIKSNNEIGKIVRNQRIKGAIYSLAFIDAPYDAIQIAVDNATKLDLTLNYPKMDSLKCAKYQMNSAFLKYQLNNKLSQTDKMNLAKEINTKYPNSILDLYLKLEKSMFQPYPPNMTDAAVFRSLFLKDIDLSDKRVPLLPNLYRFMNTMVSSMALNSTNYNAHIDAFMKGLTCKDQSYKSIAEWFVSNLAFNEAENLENSFKYLFDTYINVSDCDAFTDKEMSLYRNKNQAIVKLPYLSQIPEFELFDKEDTAHKLSEIYPESDYTLLVFFSPNCSHCQEDLPKNKIILDQIKAKHPSINLKIVSVLNDNNHDKWDTFIKTAKIEDWLNLKEKNPTMEFQDRFNSYSNPNYFLINKQGQILLKNFNIKAIEDIFNRKN